MLTACWPVILGKACSNSAKAPDTWGAAKEVPEPSWHTLALQLVMMFSPGAARYPAAATPAWLEKLDRVPEALVDPTAITEP